MLFVLCLRCSDVDFERIVQNKTLKEVINERYPHLISFHYLYERDEEGFISHTASSKQYEGNDGKYTYLQYACTFGLAKVVKVLLEYGVDPNERVQDYYDNLCHNNTYPLFIVAAYGYAEILQLFVDSENSNIIYQMNEDNAKTISDKCTYYTSALHLVIENSIKKLSKHNPGLCDYDKSFETLLPICSSLDVDFADSRGDTCLHSAAYVENQNYIHQLLDHGASLGKRNRFGTPPLEDIGVHTMRSYLNNCIRSNGACTTDDYEIEFSYEFLCPSRFHGHKPIGHQNETESSFDVTKNVPETNQLFFISEFEKCKSLLQHPVLTTITNSKWSKVERFYLLNLVFYINFLTHLTVYILLFTALENSNRKILDIYWFIVLGNLMVFCVRELFQFILSPTNYLSTLENWLEISIILITFSLLGEDSFEKKNLFETKNVSKELREQLSAIAIIISWCEFILILGKHPKFAVPLAMFKLVSKNFLTFLLWYSILIFAFVLSFYVLFTNNSGKDNNMFDNIFLTLFKTLIMLTGEFDSSSLPFSTYKIISRLIFILFVFLIPIVLVNLLNGLAVSDTRRIQKDAEIIVNVTRLRFIHSFETISMSKYAFKYFIPSLCTRLFDLNFILFPDPAECPKLKIYPNRRKYDLRRKHKRYCDVNLSGFVVNIDVVNEAKTIIKSMLENPHEHDESDENILIEEIKKELKQMLYSMKRKKKTIREL